MTEPDNVVQPAGTSEENTGAGVLFWALIVALGIVAAAAIGWTTVRIGWAEEAALPGLGQRGDFFGGILNPILTSLTFVALLVTLIMQRKEMVESRVQFTRSADALAKQNVQSSFYQLLAIHNQIIGGMAAKDPATEEMVQGREVFRVIYSKLRRDFRARSKQKANPPITNRKLIENSYGRVYSEYQEVLGHYFRYLYNTIKTLEESENFDNANSGDSEKFIKLLRAVLSDQELLVLYYNVTVSAPGASFAQIAIDHELFDNMPARLLEDEHASFIDAKAFGPVSYETKRAAFRREVVMEEIEVENESAKMADHHDAAVGTSVKPSEARPKRQRKRAGH